MLVRSHMSQVPLGGWGGGSLEAVDLRWCKYAGVSGRWLIDSRLISSPGWIARPLARSRLYSRGGFPRLGLDALD